MNSHSHKPFSINMNTRLELSNDAVCKILYIPICSVKEVKPKTLPVLEFRAAHWGGDRFRFSMHAANPGHRLSLSSYSTKHCIRV